MNHPSINSPDQVLAMRNAAWSALTSSHPFASRVINWAMESIRLSLAISREEGGSDEDVFVVWQSCVAAAKKKADEKLLLAQPEPGLDGRDFAALFEVVTAWCYANASKKQQERNPPLKLADAAGKA